MNNLDQMLLDSLMMQLEIGKMKKPQIIDVEMYEDEDEGHAHEMMEQEGSDKRYIDEGDYEGDMALVELNSIIDKAAIISNMINQNTELPAWVQSKITLAAHNMTAVHDYLKYKSSTKSIKSRKSVTNKKK